ncbi:DUF202 domain-containing protein [Demequina flava]|uniref:DUF202 domain-containing protein n=1 Tax=Demequina flava TaxID=1095025 RepID=UPI000780272F|nr:DUF202 domain-containing protein [Demequina flava]
MSRRSRGRLPDGADSHDPGPMRPPDAFDLRTLTALAWRRTSLRIGAVSIAGAQLLVLYYGPAAYLLAVLGLASALIMHLSASRRYVKVSHGIRQGEHHAGIARAGVRVGVLSIFAGLVALATFGWIVLEAYVL